MHDDKANFCDNGNGNDDGKYDDYGDGYDNHCNRPGKCCLTIVLANRRPQPFWCST